MRSGIAVWCATMQMAASVAATPDLAPQDQLSYVLETSTSIVHGFRPTPQTVYTYYRTFRNSKQELWRITLNEKYAAHWIGSHGKVWVLTDGDLGGRTAPRLWVRNAEASDLAIVRLNEAVRYLVPDIPQLQLFKTWDFNAEESGFTKLDSFRSQFKLVLDGHGEFHINEVYVGQERYRYIVTWNGTDSPTNPLDELLMGRIQPMHSRPLANQETWEVWESQDRPGPDVLAIYFKSPGRSHANVSLVLKQHELAQLPSYVTKTPRNRVLWFSFPKYGNSTVGALTVFSLGGAMIGEVDLKQAGAFKSARAAGGSLTFTDIQILSGNRWLPLDKAEWYTWFNAKNHETIKIVDAEGYRYLIEISGYGKEGSSVVCERLAPNRFLFRKEQKLVGHKLIDEKHWWSENGEFALRHRTMEDERGRVIYRQTLLREEAKVQDYEHELWSRSSYTDPKDVFVSNSGRTFVLSVDRVQYRSTGPFHEFAALIVYDYDGSRTTALSLLTDNFLGTFEQAQKSDLSGLSVTYDEPESKIKHEGSIIRRFARESYAWKLPNGSVQEFYIAETAPGGIYHLYLQRN
ncbi:MAG: hypothetical protein IH945_08505 [Armatimonadetes bacterium]|nr:hypothetical protein [Armatimonadota bacterium]